MSTTGDGTSLRGISTRINGRHAFVHERVLELIARETKASGSVDFSKAELRSAWAAAYGRSAAP